MSAATPRLRSYILKYDIVLDMRDPVSGEEREEVRKTAGETVFMRRPKAKDLRAFDGHGEDHAIAGLLDLMKRTVKLDPLEIENLDAEDFDGLGELVAPSRKSGQKTGDDASD